VKGVMFTGFVDWVEATRGLATADSLLTAAEGELSTDGAYTSVGNYPHRELIVLARALAEAEGTSTDAILRDYGRAAFGALAALQPEIMESFTNLYACLSNVEKLIHVQVRKLYQDAHPPLIGTTLAPFGEIYLEYTSQRDFTALCHGLILGAIDRYSPRATVALATHKHGEDGMPTVSTFRISGWRDD